MTWLSEKIKEADAQVAVVFREDDPIGYYLVKHKPYLQPGWCMCRAGIEGGSEPDPTGVGSEHIAPAPSDLNPSDTEYICEILETVSFPTIREYVDEIMPRKKPQ